MPVKHLTQLIMLFFFRYSLIISYCTVPVFIVLYAAYSGALDSWPLCISNGVRQGSVFSPYLFAVYIDGLLVELCNSGVGCYWGCHFAGAF